MLWGPEASSYVSGCPPMSPVVGNKDVNPSSPIRRAAKKSFLVLDFNGNMVILNFTRDGDEEKLISHRLQLITGNLRSSEFHLTLEVHMIIQNI